MIQFIICCIFIIVCCLFLKIVYFATCGKEQIYPELKTVFMNRHIIKNELQSVMDLPKWTKWIEYDNINETPIFSKMSHQQIMTHMNNNNTKLNEGRPSWRIFGLILNRQIMNDDLCPETVKMLKGIPYVINAGFSCLEAGVSTSLHKGHNHNIYRCHIPLIIPNGDCAIKINDKIIKWNTKDYFIFDDTYYHQAWNFTNESRIVLIIDIDKINYMNHSLPFFVSWPGSYNL